ncbi:MAG: hypothetical protein ACPG4T_08575 [Nannocystaceae bacterium]
MPQTRCEWMYIHAKLPLAMTPAQLCIGTRQPCRLGLGLGLSLASTLTCANAEHSQHTTFVDATTLEATSTTLETTSIASTSASPDVDSETTAPEDSTTSSSTTTGDPTSGPPRLDLGLLPDAGTPEPCPAPGPDLLYTHIWIANSAEGTVSKLDTRTRDELGRYRTSGGINDNPSRTAVNQEGDVAVVNRLGGVVKIIADPSRCLDANNDGVVTTSTHGNNVHTWGKDECVAWWTPLPPRSRPVAWTPGTIVGEGCQAHYEGINLWVSAPIDNDIRVYQLANDDGSIVNEVQIPGLGDMGPFGIYGGAVDSEGDFWGVVYNQGPLVHVNRDDLSYTLIDLPQPSAYGITVDHEGRPWVGGFDGTLQRYNPAENSWTSVETGTTSLLRGMTEDAHANLWVAALNPSGVLRVETNQNEVLGWYTELPGLEKPTGTSVDYDGMVWVVDQTAGESGGAFVLAPEDGTVVDFIGGLHGPYTYSDMTDWALGNVVHPNG